MTDYELMGAALAEADQAAALGIAGILYQNPRALASTLMACGGPIRTKNRPGLHKNKKAAVKAPLEKK